MNEWRSVVNLGAMFIVLLELIEIGKWAFTDGWSGVLRFHFRWDRMLLAHFISLLYGGAIWAILMVFGWRAFRGAPLVVLVALLVSLLAAIPFRPFLRDFFRNTDENLPVKARELPFPQ